MLGLRPQHSISSLQAVIDCAAVVDAAILNAMLLPIDVSFVKEIKLHVHDDLACPKHDL